LKTSEASENTNSPLFSIVVPVHNRSELISRTIDSILIQSFDNYEIIIIDDGSTDNLKEICDNYNSPKINYYYQQNAGSNPARNAGIQFSRGCFVSFLDSDDTWEKEFLQEVKNKFASDEEFGLVYVKSIKKYLPDGTQAIKKCSKLEGFIYRDVLQQGFLTNSSCITVKRSLLEKIGGWDNDLFACQDDDICFRLAKITKVGFIDKILSTFYIDSRINRISSSTSRRAWNSLLLWKKFTDDLLLLCGKNEFLKKITNVYFSFLSVQDKNGLMQCECLLINQLGYSKYKILIFRLKFHVIYYVRLYLKNIIMLVLPFKMIVFAKYIIRRN